MDIINCKRGDGFALPGRVQLTTGDAWTASAQLRRANGDLAAALQVQLTPDTSVEPWTHQVLITPANPDTSAWPVEVLRCDIEFRADGGLPISTPTFGVRVQRDETRPLPPEET